MQLNWSRKRITTDEVGRMFVRATLDSVELGWPEIAATVCESTEFASPPTVDPEAFGPFLVVVVVGNLDFIPLHFNGAVQSAIVEAIARELAVAIETDAAEVAGRIAQIRKMMTRLNKPSKKTTSAMARGLFTLYGLNAFQDEYFQKINTPNPLFLKRIDDLMGHFLWDWTAFNKRYKVRKGNTISKKVTAPAEVAGEYSLN